VFRVRVRVSARATEQSINGPRQPVYHTEQDGVVLHETLTLTLTPAATLGRAYLREEQDEVGDPHRHKAQVPHEKEAGVQPLQRQHLVLRQEKKSSLC